MKTITGIANICPHERSSTVRDSTKHDPTTYFAEESFDCSSLKIANWGLLDYLIFQKREKQLRKTRFCQPLQLLSQGHRTRSGPWRGLFPIMKIKLAIMPV